MQAQAAQIGLQSNADKSVLRMFFFTHGLCPVSASEVI
jgi:hypothetical protein